MKNVLFTTSAFALLAIGGVSAQPAPAPAPGGVAGPDMLCSEIISAGPEVARNAAAYFSSFVGGVPAGTTTPAQASGQAAPSQQPPAGQAAPNTAGDPTQQVAQSPGQTAVQPQSSNSNNGNPSAEIAQVASPAADGTIMTGAGNFASADNVVQPNSNTPAAPVTGPDAAGATTSLTPEQLLTACQSSPSARVASVLPEPQGAPAGATTASGSNSLQSSGGTPGANDTGTTSGTAGAPSAPTAPVEGAAPIETD